MRGLCKRTFVVQVFAKFHVSVATSSDVEVTLHPIEIQVAKDPAAVGRSPPKLGRLCELGSLPADAHDIVDVLLAEPFVVAVHRHVPLTRDDTALCVPVQPVYALVVDPVLPRGGLALEAVRGKNAIAGSVLDVDVQVGALHLHDNVHVDLEVMADALFDGKGVLLGAAPPPRQLGPDEDEGDEDHGDGPFAAARGARYILGFRFGYSMERRKCLARVPGGAKMGRGRGRDAYGMHRMR